MTAQLMVNGTVVIPEQYITDEDRVTRPVCNVCGREATFTGETIRLTCMAFNDEGIPVVRFTHGRCAEERE